MTVGPTRLPTSLVSTPCAASARTRSSPAASIWRWSRRNFLTCAAGTCSAAPILPRWRDEAVASGGGDPPPPRARDRAGCRCPRRCRRGGARRARSASSGTIGAGRARRATPPRRPPPSGAITKGLPSHSEAAAAPDGDRRGDAGPAPPTPGDAGGDQDRHEHDGHEQHGGTGRPQAGMERAPDDRAEVAAGVAERVRGREPRRALGQLGQAADAEQAEQRPHREAPRIGARGRSSSASRSRPTRPPPSQSSATPAPTATSGRMTRAQPATSASPVSMPWPTGPSCWPQSASAARTPRVISPTAHRSRAWTRQNGGRAGAGPLGTGGWFLGGGAGWRTRGGAATGLGHHSGAEITS